MNFTTEDYRNFLRNIRFEYRVNPELYRTRDAAKSDSNYAYILSKIYEQSDQGCAVIAPPSKDELVKIKENLGNNFYDFNLIKKAECSINAIFHPIAGKQGTLSITELLHISLTNPRRIGEESAFGYVFLGDIKDVSELFAIKAPSSAGESRDMYTERFVTEFGTNYMRMIGVPNFAVTYGHFLCSRPIIDPKTKRVVEFCSTLSDEKVPYVIYENVKNSISGNEYLKTCTENQFMSMYLQILMSLSIAGKKIGFTHQDLHPGNVLMRSFQDNRERFQIPYAKENGSVVYVKADSIATIIDFGLSNIVYPNQFSGSTDEPRVIGNLEKSPLLSGRYDDVVWPLHDAYKLLLFSALYARDFNNPKLYARIKIIFTFFSNENLDNVINDQFELRYTLWQTDKTKNYTVDNLINHIISKAGGSAVISTQRDTGKVLDCASCNELSLKTPVSTLNVPDSLIEFYDLVPYLRRKPERYFKAILENFDYPASLASFSVKLNAAMQNTESIIASFTVPSLSPGNILNYNTLQLVQSVHSSLYSLSSELQSITTLLTVGNWASALFKDELLGGKLFANTERLNQLKVLTCELFDQAKSLPLAINDAIASPRAKVYFDNDYRLEWYIKHKDDITSLQRDTCFPKKKQLVPKEFAVKQSNSKSDEIVSRSIRRDPISEHRDRQSRIFRSYGM